MGRLPEWVVQPAVCLRKWGTFPPSLEWWRPCSIWMTTIVPPPPPPHTRTCVCVSLCAARATACLRAGRASRGECECRGSAWDFG